MLLGPRHIHLARGPKENGSRPAIDATLRTAARAFGPRVVGAILSGMLDDGTAGLMAVKRHGGVALVQAPAEAAFPSMPTSALRYVAVDAVLSSGEFAGMFVQLAQQPVAAEEGAAMPDNSDLETDISEMKPGALQAADTVGKPAPFSCPNCGGVLNEFYDGDLLRFRCQVGHAYSPESLLSSQTEAIDYQLWAAYRALDERATIVNRLAQHAHQLSDHTREQRFLRSVEQIEAQKEQIRQVLLKQDEARPEQ
jgi:two-component system chemotaxis response regulator CheB